MMDETLVIEVIETRDYFSNFLKEKQSAIANISIIFVSSLDTLIATRVR